MSMLSLLLMNVCALRSITGVVPHVSPTYDQVNHVILPLAVPLLLFSANLRVVF